jgi:hypothetical protein
LQAGPHLQSGPQRQFGPQAQAGAVVPHLQSLQVHGLHLHWSVIVEIPSFGLSMAPL